MVKKKMTLERLRRFVSNAYLFWEFASNIDRYMQVWGSMAIMLSTMSTSMKSGAGDDFGVDCPSEDIDRSTFFEMPKTKGDKVN